MLENPTAVLIGTTLKYSCESLSAKVVICYDLKSNFLHVELDMEDFGFTSEWVRVADFSQEPLTAPKILTALAQWQRLSSQRYTQPGTRLRVIYEMSLLWEVLEHLLAPEG